MEGDVKDFRYNRSIFSLRLSTKLLLAVMLDVRFH